jgi:ssDNA-binding Zn-finger/Zn-ribbon topoisomerase 1
MQVNTRIENIKTMANKRIRLYGCPGCGSELTAKEKNDSNKEGFPCRFCISKEPLAYLGTFYKKDLYD